MDVFNCENSDLPATGEQALTVGGDGTICVGPSKQTFARRAPRAGCRTGQLAQLDDRLLRDIGLTRSQVLAAAYGLLRLREHSPASRIGTPPTAAANVVPLKRRAIAVRVDQATSAPPTKRAACG